jgi:hypothetical protein
MAQQCAMVSNEWIQCGVPWFECIFREILTMIGMTTYYGKKSNSYFLVWFEVYIYTTTNSWWTAVQRILFQLAPWKEFVDSLDHHVPHFVGLLEEALRETH